MALSSTEKLQPIEPPLPVSGWRCRCVKVPSVAVCRRRRKRRRMGVERVDVGEGHRAAAVVVGARPPQVGISVTDPACVPEVITGASLVPVMVTVTVCDGAAAVAVSNA